MQIIIDIVKKAFQSSVYLDLLLLILVDLSLVGSIYFVTSIRNEIR